MALYYDYGLSSGRHYVECRYGYDIFVYLCFRNQDFEVTFQDIVYQFTDKQNYIIRNGPCKLYENQNDHISRN